MSYGRRYFAFMDDGSIRRLPLRLVDHLCRGIDVMPEFAGQRIKIASVTLELEGRRPARILEVVGQIWQFDERGSPQPSGARSAFEARLTAERVTEEEKSTGKVISVSGRIARRQWEEKFFWEPKPEDVNRIVELIWPKI